MSAKGEEDGGLGYKPFLFSGLSCILQAALASVTCMYTGLLVDSMSLFNLCRTQGLEDRSDLSWDSTYSGILHTVSHNLGSMWYVHGSGSVSLQDGLPEHLEK